MTMAREHVLKSLLQDKDEALTAAHKHVNKGHLMGTIPSATFVQTVKAKSVSIPWSVWLRRGFVIDG